MIKTLTDADNQKVVKADDQNSERKSTRKENETTKIQTDSDDQNPDSIKSEKPKLKLIMKAQNRSRLSKPRQKLAIKT